MAKKKATELNEEALRLADKGEKKEEVVNSAQSKLSKEELSALTAEITKNVMGQLTPMLKGKENVNDLYDNSVDEDDILTTPAVFFCHSQGKTIMDDRKHGKTLYPPGSDKDPETGRMITNPYFFKKLFFQDRFGTRNRKERTWVSACSVTSKKRAEWLRNHSMMGIMFWESIEKAKNVDMFIQEKIIESFNRINAMREADIIQRCKNMGIDMSLDIKEMKRELAMKDAYSAMGDERKRFEEMAGRAFMASMNAGKTESMEGMQFKEVPKVA